MDAKLKVGVTVALLASGFLAAWYVARSVQPAATEAAAQAVHDPGAARDVDVNASTGSAGVDRRSVSASAPTESESVVAPEPAVVPRLFGVVVDTDGIPRTGVEVTFVAKASVAKPIAIPTGPDGRFELDHPGREGQLDVTTPDWIAVLPSRVNEAPLAAEHVVVVAPRIEVAGRTIDPSGAPLTLAEVAIHLPSNLRPSLARVTDQVLHRSWSTTSNERGEFRFDDAPSLEWASLSATLAGYDTAEISSPRVSTWDADLVLEALDANERHLLGHVVDAKGDPIEGAHVALACAGLRVSVTTNARGEFDLPLDAEAAGASELVAVKPGFLPGRVAALGVEEWPDPLVIVLDGQPLSITGRVIDAEGQPVPRAELLVLDSTRFGQVEMSMGGTRFHIARNLEDILGSTDFGPRRRADDEGRFEIAGLLPQSYRLRAFDARTLALAVTAPIAAGSRDVELHLPREDTWPRIAGRVVGRSGEPVAGVELFAQRAAPAPGPDSPQAFGASVRSAAVESDADGRFEIVGVARAAHTLVARSPGIYDFVSHPLSESEDLGALEIVVSQRCHVQVELDLRRSQVVSIGFAGPDGALLNATANQGEGSISGERFSVTRPRSEVLSVGDDAQELVLFDPSQRELERIPIRLVPGALNVLRP